MSREKNSTLTICQLVVGHGENLGVRCSFMISQMVEKRITRREERFPRILYLFLYSSSDNKFSLFKESQKLSRSTFIDYEIGTTK